MEKRHLWRRREVLKLGANSVTLAAVGYLGISSLVSLDERIEEWEMAAELGKKVDTWQRYVRHNQEYQQLWPSQKIYTFSVAAIETISPVSANDLIRVANLAYAADSVFDEGYERTETGIRRSGSFEEQFGRYEKYINQTSGGLRRRLEQIAEAQFWLELSGKLMLKRTFEHEEAIKNKLASDGLFSMYGHAVGGEMGQIPARVLEGQKGRSMNELVIDLEQGNIGGDEIKKRGREIVEKFESGLFIPETRVRTLSDRNRQYLTHLGLNTAGQAVGDKYYLPGEANQITFYSGENVSEERVQEEVKRVMGMAFAAKIIPRLGIEAMTDGYAVYFREMRGRKKGVV